MPELPFDPERATLYSGTELYAGFDSDDPASFTRTADFKSFMYFEQHERNMVSDRDASIHEAMHDTAMTRAMYHFLADHDRAPVAIMGGHDEARGSDVYVAVVKIAKTLTEEGLIIASGGGPGCMEAAHLGALLAGKSDDDIADAISQLKSPAPNLPKGANKIFTRDTSTGNWRIDYAKAAELHSWLAPALKLAKDLMPQSSTSNISLAIPTWHYGHEPLTPLATHVAKYFLNSTREDLLLAIAKNGIVYTKGKAGTLQEVFQDAAQNYYRDPQAVGSFAPMIFYGTQFWSSPPSICYSGNPSDYDLPIRELLFSLFVRTGNTTEEQFKHYVRFCDKVEDVVDAIITLLPPKPVPELSISAFTSGATRNMKMLVSTVGRLGS